MSTTNTFLPLVSILKNTLKDLDHAERRLRAKDLTIRDMERKLRKLEQEVECLLKREDGEDRRSSEEEALIPRALVPRRPHPTSSFERGCQTPMDL